MYPKISAIQYENTIFSPSGKKSLVRAQLADKIIKEMEANELKAVVCRPLNSTDQKKPKVLPIQ